MAIALVSHGIYAGTGPSSSIDTTGATLLVVFNTGVATIAAPTDNQGNTYTSLTHQAGRFSGELSLYYCLNPTTSATHTFSNGSTTQGQMAYAALSGVGSYDQQSGSDHIGGFSQDTNQPGALTAAANGALYITGCGAGGGQGIPSIDSGFTITDEADATAGVNYTTNLAYFIQATAASLNPTWTVASGSGGSNACVLATFLPIGAVTQPILKSSFNPALYLSTPGWSAQAAHKPASWLYVPPVTRVPTGPSRLNLGLCVATQIDASYGVVERSVVVPGDNPDQPPVQGFIPKATVRTLRMAWDTPWPAQSAHRPASWLYIPPILVPVGSLSVTEISSLVSRWVQTWAAQRPRTLTPPLLIQPQTPQPLVAFRVVLEGYSQWVQNWPAQFVKPVRDIEAPPPTFKPEWAVNSNQLVGPIAPQPETH